MNIPDITEIAGRRVYDVSGCADFRAALRRALSTVSAVDAVVTFNTKEQALARAELDRIGMQNVTVAVNSDPPTGTTVNITGGAYEHESATLLGGTGEQDEAFVVLGDAKIIRLPTTQLRAARRQAPGPRNFAFEITRDDIFNVLEAHKLAADLDDEIVSRAARALRPHLDEIVARATRFGNLEEQTAEALSGIESALAEEGFIRGAVILRRDAAA